MYLVETSKGDFRCENANDVKSKFTQSEVKNIYMLQKVNYSDLVATSDIRDCIYEYLKGRQEDKDEVIDFVSERLDVKKTEVSKTINAMKREGIIYKVAGFDWIGIN